MTSLCAIIGHAQRNIIHGFRHRSKAAWADYQRSEIAAETCLAFQGSYFVVHRARHSCDHAGDRQVEDLCLALAGTLYAGGC